MSSGKGGGFGAFGGSSYGFMSKGDAGALVVLGGGGDGGGAPGPAAFVTGGEAASSGVRGFALRPPRPASVVAADGTRPALDEEPEGTGGVALATELATGGGGRGASDADATG